MISQAPVFSTALWGKALAISTVRTDCRKRPATERTVSPCLVRMVRTVVSPGSSGATRCDPVRGSPRFGSEVDFFARPTRQKAYRKACARGARLAHHGVPLPLGAPGTVRDVASGPVQPGAFTMSTFTAWAEKALRARRDR